MRKTILKWLILTSLIAYAVIAAIWAPRGGEAAWLQWYRCYYIQCLKRRHRHQAGRYGGIVALSAKDHRHSP